MKRREGNGATVAFEPGVQMPGTPTLAGHRIAAETLAIMAWERGVREILKDIYPHLERGDILVSCWWAGLYGLRKWRQRYGEWAQMAGWHLWYRCEGFPDPPMGDQP